MDYAIFGLTEPYPGTELWSDAQKYGRFDTTGRYKNNLLLEVPPSGFQTVAKGTNSKDR